MVLLAFLALFLLAACGDEPTPTPPPGVATVTGPVVRDTPPPPTATEVPTVPPTVRPTATPSEGMLATIYVLQATSIISGVVTAPEIGNAIAAAGDAGSTALFGGNVNVNDLTDKVTKAADVVSNAGTKFAALTPPAAYKPLHDQLLGVFASYDASFSQAEKAVQNGDWVALATAAGNIASATNDLNTLLNKLNSQ